MGDRLWRYVVVPLGLVLCLLEFVHAVRCIGHDDRAECQLPAPPP